MNLTCPGCGLHGPVEAFVAPVDAAQVAQLMGRVPPELADLVLRYCGLFAPARHKLTGARARRVLGELVDLMQAGSVTRNRREWPAPAAAWATALAHMLEQRARLTLPLRSHGYVLEVIVGLADRAEAQAEAQREQHRKNGTTSQNGKSVPSASPQSLEAPDALMKRMRARQELSDAAHQQRAASAPPPAANGADSSARKAAEEEIEARRKRAAPEFYPEPLRGQS